LDDAARRVFVAREQRRNGAGRMKILSIFRDQPDNILTRALRDGKNPALFAFTFSAVSNLLYLAMPLYTFQIYGRVLTSQSEATLWVLTLVTLFVFAISSMVDDYRARILINFGMVFDQRVSGHIFSGLFDAAVRGDPSAKSQAMRDLDTFRQTITGVGAAALFDLPWIFIFLAVLFAIDPLIGLVTTVGAVGLLLLALAQEKAIRPSQKEAIDAQLKSYGFTEAALRNAEVVRAMGMLPPLGAAWARHRAVSMEQGAETSEKSNLYSDIIKSLRMGMQVLVVAIGAYLILEGKIHSGMLFANMILASRALAPIERLVGAWETINGGIRAHERLTTLLGRAEAPATHVTSLPRPIGRLSSEGVGFALPGSQRLFIMGVNFTLEPGEVLGLVGPSGAGKSTLARLLMGIWKPTTGTVRLDGADVFAWDRADFGRHVGYLPQDTELFAGTVRDNIARFQEDVTDEDVVAAAKQAGAYDLIARMPKSFDTEVGEGGVVLSAGQRQRVGLARALLRDPAYIVLDEPNASLDAEGEEALAKAIESVKARGATVVVISHKISVFRAADKMLLMRDGRMEAFGPRDQILSRLRPPAEVRAIEAGR
jgi:PrtD family type I secretion system ABC transporter